MVKSCAICRRGPPKGPHDGKISFHFLPQATHIREKWLNVLREIFGKDWTVPSLKRLSFCADHFLPSDYKTYGALPRLKDAAVPSQKLVPVASRRLPKRKEPLASTEVVEDESEEENNATVRLEEEEENFATIRPEEEEENIATITPEASPRNFSCNVLEDHNYINVNPKSTDTNIVNLSDDDSTSESPDISRVDPLSNNVGDYINGIILEPDESLQQSKENSEKVLKRVFSLPVDKSSVVPSKNPKIVPDNLVPINSSKVPLVTDVTKSPILLKKKQAIKVYITPSTIAKNKPSMIGHIIVPNNKAPIVKLPELSKKPEPKTQTENPEVPSTPVVIPQKVRTLQDLPSSMKETLRLNKPASAANSSTMKYRAFKQDGPVCSLSEKTRLVLSGWTNFAINAKHQPLSWGDHEKIENTAIMFERVAMTLRGLQGDETKGMQAVEELRRCKMAAVISQKKLNRALETKSNYERKNRSLTAKIRRAFKKIQRLEAEVKKLSSEVESNPALDRMLAKLPEMGKQLLLRAKWMSEGGSEKVGYDKQIRKMCCVLQLISRPSYKYFRKFVFNCLPDCQSVAKWLRALRVEMGYEFSLRKPQIREANKKLLYKLLAEDSVIMEALEKDAAKRTQEAEYEGEQMMHYEEGFFEATSRQNAVPSEEMVAAVDSLIDEVLAE